MTITRAFLFFSHWNCIIPLMIIGYFWVDRTIAHHAACLIALSIIVNVALKVTFQIPLPPSVSQNWFSFPSGHMQLSTVFYGWLTYRLITYNRPVSELKNTLGQVNKTILLLFLFALLTGIGWSLVKAGYHTYDDVIAGAFVGFSLVILYDFLISKYPKRTPFLLVVITTMLMVYVSLRYLFIPFHACIAYLLLLVYLVISKCFEKSKRHPSPSS